MSDEWIVAIDFDGTLHDQSNREPGYRMGKPFPGAKEALERLQAAGAKIVIHTCRARAPHGEIDPDYEEYVSTVDHVAQWLDFFELPYDEITALKPLATAYVDDKAVAFTGDWTIALHEVLGLRHAEEAKV